MTQAERQLAGVPQQLRRARESLGLSIPEAAALVGVPEEMLASWETGESSPDDSLLWRLAEVYGRTVGYFFSEAPAAPSRQDFRVSRVREEPRDPEIRRLATAEFEELCRARTALETRQGRRRGRLLESLRQEARGIEDPEALAEFVRSRPDVGSGPIDNVRRLMESWGVKVFLVNLPRDSPTESLSGTSWMHPAYGPAALINRGDSAGRRNFTLAHELAHLLRLDVQPMCDLNDQVAEERFANRFAASFLMPQEHLKAFVRPLLETGELGGWDATRATIDRIARRYGTSVEATSIRLEELGFLPSGFTEENRPDLARQYFRGSRGRRWRKAVRDLGEEYSASVREAYRRGELSLSAVAQLLRIDVDQAHDWLEAPD